MKFGEKRLFAKGEYFIHAGDVLKQVGLIISGGFTHSRVDSSGNQKAVGFVFEGSVLANYLSSMLGKTMPTDIVALEDSEVLVIPARLLRERFLSDPTLHTLFLQALFEQSYEHVLNDYRYTAEERYRQLCIRCPHIFDVASLGEIASYLNISRRQLHRFRKPAEHNDP